MSISFAVTAYNEMSNERHNGRHILRCIQAAKVNPVINEIVIVDDASKDFDQLETLLKIENCPKLKLYRQHTNQGVFGNKLEAVYRSTSDWVITCDSDNVMDCKCLNLLTNLLRTPSYWYCPSFAKPSFDYRHLDGVYSINTINELLSKPMADCCLNTGNQMVHRNSFLNVFKRFRQKPFNTILTYGSLYSGTDKEKCKQVWNAADSFVFNMEWLAAGGSLDITPGFEYDHFVGKGQESNYARAPKEKIELAQNLRKELERRCKEANLCQ